MADFSESLGGSDGYPINIAPNAAVKSVFPSAPVRPKRTLHGTLSKLLAIACRRVRRIRSSVVCERRGKNFAVEFALQSTLGSVAMLSGVHVGRYVCVGPVRSSRGSGCSRGSCCSRGSSCSRCSSGSNCSRCSRKCSLPGRSFSRRLAR